MSTHDGSAERHRPEALHLTPLPLSLLDEPLDYTHAEHYRQRCIAAALRRFASEGSACRTEADMVIAYLDRDIGLHHQDEDEDLFPALRRKASPSDNLGPILARLGDDHRQAAPMLETIIAALSRKLADDPVKIRKSDRETMMAFAKAEQHHLAIESGIVLVIARKRLSKSNLAMLSQSMKARRGVSC